MRSKRPSYKTFLRALGRKTPPPPTALRTVKQPGDKELIPNGVYTHAAAR